MSSDLVLEEEELVLEKEEEVIQDVPLLKKRSKQVNLIETDKEDHPVEDIVPTKPAHSKQGTETKKNQTGRSEEKKQAKASIPFNVLMLPKDRSKTQAESKGGKDTYNRPPIHLLNIPQKRRKMIPFGWINRLIC